MNLTVNGFKKFLVDEVARKSNATYSDALSQVMEFSKDPNFPEHFKKWEKVNARYDLKVPFEPRSIKDILVEVTEKWRN